MASTLRSTMLARLQSAALPARRRFSSAAAAAYDPSTAASFGHLSADEAGLKDGARKFFMDKFNPLFKRMDDEDWFPDDAFPTLGRQGYLGLTISPEYGGAGLDFLSGGLIAEELHYANSSLGISHSASDNLCANNIYLNGTEEQCRRFLPGLCDGSMIGALGMSEAGAGSDAIGSMATRAKRDAGDGSYILNGSKLWITNGPVADVVLVYAKMDEEAGAAAAEAPGGGKKRSRNEGVTAFLVEKGTPGFIVGKKMDQKMGFRGSPQSELVFEDVRVPAGNLLGPERGGVGIMMSGLDLERAWVAAGSLGVASRALDLAVEQARQRVQFQQPIGNFQLIQDKLARMYTQLSSAQLLTYKALAACDAVEAGGAGRGEIHLLSTAAYIAATDAVKTCCDEGVQIFGGMGYMKDMEINALYRTVKTSEIAGGSMEIRKLIVAKELLQRK